MPEPSTYYQGKAGTAEETERYGISGLDHPSAAGLDAQAELYGVSGLDHRSGAGPNTRVELEAGSKGCTARLYGEVDIASRKFVEDALVFALENSGGALTVDLDTLDFMDSQGIHMLRRLRDEANKSGAKLKVRSGLGVHRKLLELGGIRDVIDR